MKRFEVIWYERHRATIEAENVDQVGDIWDFSTDEELGYPQDTVDKGWAPSICIRVIDDEPELPDQIP